MAEAGSIFLADVMLWLMYIALAVALVAAVVSSIRSFWIQKQ